MTYLIFCIILAAIGGTLCLAEPPARRKNIEALSDEELLCYRENLQAAIDNGTYSTIAEWHAMPLMSTPELVGYSCHGTPTFLLWYRFYLSSMERVIGCPIPYWDWTSASIPHAFTDTYYTARNGTSVLNPLKSVVLPKDVQTSEHVWPNSDRSEESPFPGVEIKEKEEYALYGCNDFKNFSAALEDCHNLAHIAVAGTMSVMTMSAFDPLFWSLHMNIDRLFFQWQLIHDRYVYPPDVAEAPIELSSYTIPASDLLTYFDGWLQGCPPDEAERWKKSLRAALSRSKSLTPATAQPVPAPLPPSNQVVAHREPLPSQSGPGVIVPAAPESDDPDEVAPFPMVVLSISESPDDPDSMQPEPIQHVECPFPVAEIGTRQLRECLIVTIKDVSPTPKPYTLVAVLGDKIAGRVGMPGMGRATKTICTMDRHVDISRSYEKLGFQANGTTPEELLACLTFRMTPLHGHRGIPYTPINVVIEMKVF